MPVPQTLAETATERRWPAAVGILIAMGASVALWGAIYAACILRF